MSERTLSPVSVVLDRARELRIRWSDGATTVLALPRLRACCPCAACRAERAEAEKRTLPLAADAGAQQSMAAARGVDLVGRYAIRITWQDGHDAGIYDYDYLRMLAGDAPPAPGEP